MSCYDESYFKDGREGAAVVDAAVLALCLAAGGRHLALVVADALNAQALVQARAVEASLRLLQGARSTLREAAVRALEANGQHVGALTDPAAPHATQRGRQEQLLGVSKIDDQALTGAVVSDLGHVDGSGLHDDICKEASQQEIRRETPVLAESVRARDTRDGARHNNTKHATTGT